MSLSLPLTLTRPSTLSNIPHYSRRSVHSTSLMRRTIGRWIFFHWTWALYAIWRLIQLVAWLSGKGVGLWLVDFLWYAPDLWLTRDHFVGKASAMGHQPGQLSLLPSVGRGMSSISEVRWTTPLAAGSPSSECLYEGKADVVYLQVTLCDPHLSA